MKRSTVLVFLFGLFLGGCGSSRQGGEEAEVVRHLRMSAAPGPCNR